MGVVLSGNDSIMENVLLLNHEGGGDTHRVLDPEREKKKKKDYEHAFLGNKHKNLKLAYKVS
jgi:hypothetical protein